MCGIASLAATEWLRRSLHMPEVHDTEVGHIMRLAKLTVTGFKSFADKTEFTFDAPVTGIVGPNGCGKSNVVDAIKWVLGERSAKSLRGKEMMDVIFAGSAGRKPGGLASVVLTFDNPLLDDEAAAALDARRADVELEALSRSLATEATGDEQLADDAEASDSAEPQADMPEGGTSWREGRRRALAVDTEQVDVERRLYRDGTSQYLINGRRARLRDIKELFMDTGVGAHAYSIIEQGKVDSMLLANPVERRTFFEEAAGVAKFKARRIEAIRKLERAENNLIRVREQLESTERRLRIVRGQANKARTFQRLDSEHRGLRTALAFHQYDEIVRQLASLTSQLASLEAERSRATMVVAELESDKQEAELARHELDTARQRLEREHASAEHRRQTAEQRRAMTQRQRDDDTARIAGDRDRLEAVDARIQELGIEAEERAGVAEDLASQLAHTERRLAEAAEAKQRAQSRLAEDRHALTQSEAALQRIDREANQRESRLQTDRARLEQLAEQSDRLEAKARELEASSARVVDELQHHESAEREQRESVVRTEAEIAALLSDADSLGAQQREWTSELNDIEQAHARLDSRRATLQEMVDARTGLGDAVKSVLELRDDLRAQGEEHRLCARVVAPLAELIEVDAEDARAVEALLGPSLQALVVDRIDPASDRPDIDALPGRVTLLPLDCAETLADTRTPELPAHVSTRVRPLSERVRCDEQMRSLVDRVLGRAMLVPDLESAAMLAMGPLAGTSTRFVTTFGEVMEPDGRVIAGPTSAGNEESGSGLLQRATELAGLESELSAMAQQIEYQRERIGQLDERGRDINERLAEKRRALAAQQREHIAAESAIERLHAEAQRVDRERDSSTKDSSAVAERRESLESSCRELESAIDEIRSQREAHAHAKQDAEARVAESAKKAEEAGEIQTEARVASSKQSEQLSAARRELRRIDAASGEATREAERLRELIEDRSGRLSDHERVIADAQHEIVSAQEEANTTRGELDALRERLSQVQALVSDIASKLADATGLASETTRRFQGIELTKRELEVRRETLEERSLDEIALDLPIEFGAYRQLMADGDVLPIDPQPVEHEIAELRTAIKKLGNVNIDAIQEETTLEGRNEELIAQVEDIDNARTHLEELITRLSDASRERFKETFEHIQAHFAGKDGMYRRLFGGGRAELRMLPHADTGEIDWLESGVEVMAKPPGKEPRSISQLSGGEKTMTAVALLLSIFQSKPSPFCVLDEVDAALDDANVERFAGIIKQFTHDCHFIVITHNKRTMHAADQLFGVTMQERGVSTRVRVKFEEVSADGRIAKAAVERSAQAAASIVEPKPKASPTEAVAPALSD